MQSATEKLLDVDGDGHENDSNGDGVADRVDPDTDGVVDKPLHHYPPTSADSKPRVPLPVPQVSAPQHQEVAGAHSDAALSVLDGAAAAAAWRVTVDWGNNVSNSTAVPKDLDANAYLAEKGCHLYFATPRVQCRNGIRGTLHKDSAPRGRTEVMELRNVSGQSGLVVFKVRNFSKRPGIESSGATVHLQRGDGKEAKTFRVGESDSGFSSGVLWSVFSVDPKTQVAKPCQSHTCLEGQESPAALVELD